MDDRDALQTAQAKGEAIGEARGEARGEIKGKVKFARDMGMSAEAIAGKTGIPLEAVREIMGS